MPGTNWRAAIFLWRGDSSHAGSPGPPGAQQHIPNGAIAIGYLFLGLIQIFIDPLGLADAADRQAHDVVMQSFLGPNYGPGSDDVSVVLFQESTLKSMANVASDLDAEDKILVTGKTPSWPVPLAMHARVLDAILLENPTGIFVDIAFVDQRDDDGVEALQNRILDEIKWARAQKDDTGNSPVPRLFFVELAEAPPRSDLVSQPCDGQGHGDCVGNNLLLEQFFERALLPAPKTPDNGILRYYDASTDTKRGHRPTAAFAMLDAVQPDLVSALRTETPSGSYLADIALIWGSQPHPDNTDWMDDCNHFDYGFVRRIVNALFFSNEAYRQSCPNIATIPVEWLLWGQDPDIGGLIRDRWVVYGADLSAARDLVYPPNYQSLAGAYMHAAALDNLLNLEDGYLRHSNHSQVIDLFALIVLALIFLLFRRIDARTESSLWNESSTQVALRAVNFGLYLVASLGFIFLFGYLQTAEYRIAPYDWVSILGLWMCLNLSWLYSIARLLLRLK